MSWTTPRTWTTSETVTAAMMNTHVRDNTSYLYDQPMALVANTSSQTITASTNSTLQFNTTVLSTPGITLVGSTTQLKPSVSGTFETWANIAWAGSASGARLLVIVDSAGPNVAQTSLPTVATGHHLCQSASGMTPIMDGSSDHLECHVYHDASGSQSVLGTGTSSGDFGGAETCHFGIKMLGTGV